MAHETNVHRFCKNIPGENVNRMRFKLAIILIVFSLTLWSQSAATGPSQPETKIQGKIVSMEIVPIDGYHPEGGIRLTVQSDESNWTVHIGPQWVKDNRNIGVGLGSEVMVIGTTLRFGKSSEISLRQIKKKD